MAKIPIEWGARVQFPDGLVVTSESFRFVAKKGGEDAPPNGTKDVGWCDDVVLPDGTEVSHTRLRMIAQPG
jgi:hypothetical protein